MTDAILTVTPYLVLFCLFCLAVTQRKAKL